MKAVETAPAERLTSGFLKRKGLTLAINRFGNQMMQRRLAAGRVGVAGITGQQESLATTTTEITLFFGTGIARFRQPVQPAVFTEKRGFVPDPAQ
jgi:hypothetical protein